MKIGVNSPCPCGSGKKYKHCCKNHFDDTGAAIFDELAQLLTDDPDSTMADLSRLAESLAIAQNSRGLGDFCGLSAEQMNNWMYEPFADLKGVRCHAPEDLSSCPVMRYLELILSALAANNGRLKATEKGNLPAKLVKEAKALLSEFTFGNFNDIATISDFSGANEEKFNALHYTRLLADISGIIKYKKGHFVCSARVLEAFNRHGVQPFYYAMIESAVRKFNWCYMDSFTDQVPLPIFCLFMLWRLQQHGSVQRMQQELLTALPDLSVIMPTSEDDNLTREERLEWLVEVRFLHRFLEFWGFAKITKSWGFSHDSQEVDARMQPLFTQAFAFDPDLPH